jgi:hypothetical protein
LIVNPGAGEKRATIPLSIHSKNPKRAASVYFFAAALSR